MSMLDALILSVIIPALNVLSFIVIVGVVLNLLINFNVVNAHNQVVNIIWRITSTITEPLLRPIRNILPSLGGIDFSPLVLILLIAFTERILWAIARGNFTGLI